MSTAKADKKFIWHPYTQMKTAVKPIVIKSGKGTWLFDEGGRKYIDAVSSWWVNLHGHSNPYIAKEISKQLNTLEHVIFADFTHKKAAELAEKLFKLLPKNQKKIFFSDDGSTSVEVALKLAVKFWNNCGQKRSNFIAFKNGYHGDTFGSMSVSHRGEFVKGYTELLFDVISIPVPAEENKTDYLNNFKSLLKINKAAAFIFEPLIQGAAGMKMYNADVLDEMLRICKNENVITIADEVMTGFYRTGKFLATDYLKNKPDIICLSKGITGGFMPLGATICTRKIYDAFLSDDKKKMFFHGHSYTANPLSCAAASANLDLLRRKSTLKNIRQISEMNLEFKNTLTKKSNVKNARSLGTIFAFEIVSSSADSYFNNIRDRLYREFIKNGVLLRPLGNTVYIMPPYCITTGQLKSVYRSILEVLDSF